MKIFCLSCTKQFSTDMRRYDIEILINIQQTALVIMLSMMALVAYLQEEEVSFKKKAWILCSLLGSIAVTVVIAFIRIWS